MHRILPLVVLLFVYLAFSASAGIANLVIGLVIAVCILTLMRHQPLGVNWGGLPAASLALAKYLAVLIRDTALGGIRVARIVLHPELPLRSGIVAIAPECDSELGRAISAHAISLSPGELLIEMDDDGTMYIHSLDVEETETSALEAQTRRRGLMRRIFD